MPGPNLLIGNGQVLANQVSREMRGSSPKEFPYTIDRARERLAPGIDLIAQAIEELPEDAKPRGEGTGMVLVHPAFLAKTRMPSGVFRRAGLRMVGSRSASVLPERDDRKSAPSHPQATAELYVCGTSEAFKELGRLLREDRRLVVQEEFRKMEAISPLLPDGRLIHLEGSDEEVELEVVLHGDASDKELLDKFEKHAKNYGARVRRDKLLGVPGLVFMPALAPRVYLADFAAFGPLRAVRRLPQLRLHRPAVRTTQTGVAPPLPNEDSLDKSLKVVVFDGGLGSSDLERWTTEHVPSELASTHSEYLLHGNDVTSALLFGPADAGQPLQRPYFDVLHERVIGSADEKDVDLYDCMKRIQAVLSRGDVDFANLSLGPRLAIDDDQPHAWTVMLDELLATGKTLATVAVGNDGAAGDKMGRIQPPGDAVNALAVGSADSREFLWSRAHYSCYGPGRSPGLVKPDGLVFGGTTANPLVLFNPMVQGLTGVQGTSFAAPLALRAAAAARALAKTQLSATALRALMIQRADRSGGHDPRDVGWGRLPEDPRDLLTCGDHEVSVLYQGSIEAGARLRIRLPVPPVAMGVGLSITATFCFTSPIDAADPVNYTRHGLTIYFRPRGEGSSASFFSRGEYESEEQLRHDAHKWETVLHQTVHFEAHELLDSFFDVDHGARDHGLPASDAPALPYVLVVTISTQKGEPIYNAVMNRYKALAPIELRSQPQVQSRPRT
jgi:hypothetical protein